MSESHAASSLVSPFSFVMWKVSSRIAGGSEHSLSSDTHDVSFACGTCVVCLPRWAFVVLLKRDQVVEDCGSSTSSVLNPAVRTIGLEIIPSKQSPWRRTGAILGNMNAEAAITTEMIEMTTIRSMVNNPLTGQLN